ncbi:MAG TPA: hypothetical protein VKU19_19985 [Bryobacteraceae bacterium]|nr:hypothetical protein [Bryobacteraceae bacterium]
MKAFVLAMLVACPLAAADGIVTVEKWRMHVGDDPRWAAPDFDDSTWEASHWPTRHNSAQPFFAGMR